MKPVPDVEVTGTVTRMSAERGADGDVVVVAYVDTGDGQIARTWLRLPADCAGYLRGRLASSTPTAGQAGDQ
ncbi:hypothetical protein [Saccharopolyspora taberi]|uniref:Uncharacterized protein n=1 Tax=Saccharopolyspora taberi TaxID=60895 RepID=A0ABN3VF28_9PSEU